MAPKKKQEKLKNKKKWEMSSFEKKLKSLHIFVEEEEYKNLELKERRKEKIRRRDWRNIVLVYDKNKRLQPTPRLKSAFFIEFITQERRKSLRVRGGK